MSGNIRDDNIAPGTVRLIDANGELNVKHSAGHGDIILVPTPSGQESDSLYNSGSGANICHRRSRRSSQLDKEAEAFTDCLYGRVHRDDGLSECCCLFGRQVSSNHNCHIPYDRLLTRPDRYPHLPVSVSRQSIEALVSCFFSMAGAPSFGRQWLSSMASDRYTLSPQPLQSSSWQSHQCVVPLALTWPSESFR